MTQRESAARRWSGPPASVRLAFLTALALAASVAWAPAGEVTTHDPAAACAGYNLRVTRSPSGAVLMDMDGNTLHKWTCRLEDAFPGAAAPDVPGFSEHWTAARLLPDGCVLGVFGGIGLVKLDSRSQIVWTHKGGEHSDLAVADDGNIFVLGSQEHRVNWVNQGEPIVEDYVLVLNELGSVVRSVPLLSAVSKSDYSNVIKTSHMPRYHQILRANSIDVLDGSMADRIPSFSEGNVLVSLRGINTLAVIDMEARVITWALFGMWHGQLDSELLPDGNVLVMEHRGDDPGVVEIDPVTMELEWSYGRDSSSALDDRWGGKAQRLSNGNTLISESGRARAFEITPDGEIVWEYVNTVAGGGLAMPFELTRIDPSFPMDWLGN
jgi:hypothetical protein